MPELGVVQGRAELVSEQSVASLPQSSEQGRRVVSTIRSLSNDVYEVLFVKGEEALRGTGAHPLYSLDRDDWVRIRDLLVGERLQTADGAVTVEALEKVRGVHRVYNLEVEGDHEYLVGEWGVRAHNNCFDVVRERMGLPKSARLTQDVDDVFSRPSKNHGIDPKLAGERLHDMKTANGLGGADNVVFDMTGNVFNPKTGELMGTLTEGGASLVR
ncbi:MAG: Hint domain-containing protein [Myxococcota bacterium]